MPKEYKKLMKGLPHSDLSANLPVDYDLQGGFKKLTKRKMMTSKDFDF